MTTTKALNADGGLARTIDALEEEIVLGLRHPNERLIEDELMLRFGIKRHVVRTALTHLEHMGMLERRKNVGAAVRCFSATEVKELYALRQLLETEAARLIPLPVEAEGLAALIAVQREHDQATAAGDARRVFRTNLAFHQVLFSLARNEALSSAIAEYARRTHPIRFMTLTSAEHRQRSSVEHWDIIKALRDGKRESLVALCGSHLMPSRDAYLARYSSMAG